MGEYAKYGFDQQGWYGMFVACGIWCLASTNWRQAISTASLETDKLFLSKDESFQGKNIKVSVVLFCSFVFV